MQIILQQQEIEEALSNYVKTLGLDFGDNVPTIEMSTTGKGKDVQILAQLEIKRFVSIGAGTLEILTDKPKEDLEVFKKAEPIVEVKVPATAKKVTRKKNTTKAEPEPTIPAVPVKRQSGVDSLFGEEAGKREEAEAELEVPVEVVDDLFGGAAGNNTEAEEVPSSEEEETLPSAGDEEVIVPTSDDLFAKKA